jgi:acyl-coenzyme A thioesterase PaaI-like protein
MSDENFAAARAALQNLPYVRMLGFDIAQDEAGLRGLLPYQEHLIGNPLVPALHGGVVAALLHFTAAAQLMLDAAEAKIPQVFTCTIEYLASPDLQDSFATAEIVSRSRRFANVRATAWQPHTGKMISAATMQFLVG